VIGQIATGLLPLENALATNSQYTYNESSYRGRTSLPQDVAGAKGVKTNRKIERAEVPKIDAGILMASGKEIILVHKDSEYRLRLTSNDKLILTK
jgi:hemin uptake protein HemP